MENKYSLFEKQIWTFYKALRTLYTVIAYSVILVPLTRIGSFVGLVIRGKVLNQYLCEFLCEQDMVTKRSVPSPTQEIAQWLIISTDKPFPQQRHVLNYGDHPNGQNICLMHCFLTVHPTDGNKTNRKQQPIEQGHGMANTEGKFHKIIKALLVVRQLGKKMKISIFSIHRNIQWYGYVAIKMENY